MNALEIIYLTTTSGSVLTALPQVRQLLVLKNSDELNAFSWAAWLVAQITALFYAISIASIPYVIVNIMWILFYATMLGLIIKYRPRGSRRLAPEEVPVEK
jgi:uncharacterized protein with PQ loop repeat